MAEARSMPQVVIVTPALREANNGNWQTARRWQRQLSDNYFVRLVKQWPSSLACRLDWRMLIPAAKASPDSTPARKGSSTSQPTRVALRILGQ